MQNKSVEKRVSVTSVQWEESVSTWVDGEAPIRPEELDSPYGRQLWDTYHLIGDVMRRQELAIEPSERFYARVSKAIDEAPTVVAPGRVRKSARRRWSGMAVAAALVLAVGVWFGMGANESSGPAEAPILVQAEDELPWSDYLDAHQSLAGVAPARYASFTDGVR